jgi:hypothetical protein
METMRNAPNAFGPARGHRGRAGRQKEECRMQNGELFPPSSWPSPPGEGGVARGHWGRFRTAQWQIAGAARGHYRGLPSAKAEGLSDRNTFFIYDTDERGSGLEENVRLCSPMFAYVRLMGKKCLRHRMVNAVQSCKMHGKPK